MVVKPLFTLKNATFWSFWLRAGLAPQPFIFWVWNIGSCVLSSSRATKWPPYELILSISKFPYIRYIRLYGVYTVIYGIYTVYGNPIYGLGQPYIYTILANPTHEHRHSCVKNNIVHTSQGKMHFMLIKYGYVLQCYPSKINKGILQGTGTETERMV